MILHQEKTTDQGKEKHVPVVEKSAEGIIVKPGSVPHPMEENHFIEWIEVRTGNNVFIKGLFPDEKPEAGFCVADTDVKVRAYCNVHGLWTNRLLSRPPFHHSLHGCIWWQTLIASLR